MSDNPSTVVAPLGGATTRRTDLVPSGKYVCEKCANVVEVLVRMSELPVCTKHTGVMVPMKKEGK
jgi:predicted nucleic acid-binding Zn ribbon protein